MNRVFDSNSSPEESQDAPKSGGARKTQRALEPVKIPSFRPSAGVGRKTSHTRQSQKRPAYVSEEDFESDPEYLPASNLCLLPGVTRRALIVL